MSRPHINISVPALALRRAEAAAAVGVSLETFDRYVRAELRSVQLGGVTVYPVAAIDAFLERHAASVADELLPRRHRRTA